MSTSEQQTISPPPPVSEMPRQPRHRIGSGLFTTSGFFVLRSPALPVDDFLSLGTGLRAPAAIGDDAELAAALRHDRRLVTDRIVATCRRPAVQEALFVASPSIVEQLSDSNPAGGDAGARQLARGLNRYLSRMTCRSTPFGLFAGCSLGRIGRSVSLSLAAGGDNRRHTRLDMNYLSGLCREFERDPDIRSRLRFTPNHSLYTASDRLRYVEARVDGTGRSHHLVAIDRNIFLEHALAVAAAGAGANELAAALTGLDGEISHAAALAFIEELVETQILVSELTLPVTGRDATTVVLERLSRVAPEDPRVRTVAAAAATLTDLDTGRRDPAPKTYHDLAHDLEVLPAPVDVKHLVQVDLFKPGGDLLLNGSVAKDVLRGLEILYRLYQPPTELALDDFRKRFAARYEDRDVPLTEVLDEEVGLGFAASQGPRAEDSPLLNGLRFPGKFGRSRAHLGPVHDLLLRKYTEAIASHAREIELSDEDLKRFPVRGEPLPDSLGAMCTLVAESAEAVAAGDYRVSLKSVAGPPGARMLGRFCHLDEGLNAAVSEYVRREEAHNPDAVYAEIVHLPEGRLGNILFRPQLRPYEIVLSGSGSVDSEHQIALTDLFLGLERGRLVLRSRRLGKEVIPRLTSAHNFTARSIGIYKFLCCLQMQGVTAGLSWDWGALANAPYLPRVVRGRLVLARATWRLNRQDVKRLTAGDDTARYRVVQELRRERNLPRVVELVEGDNCLPVDLDNAVGVDTLLDRVKKRGGAILEEFYPGPQDMPVGGPEGTYAHEIVLPILREVEEKRDDVEAEAVMKFHESIMSTRAAPVCFQPGSEWFYAKLYCGTADADRILTETIAPLVDAVAADGLIENWFFIRYGDPDWHLRVRFRASAPENAGVLLQRLSAATGRLTASGVVRDLALASYSREVERYGGVKAIGSAEQMFDADSTATVGILGHLAGDADARWRLTLAGMDMLMVDLGLDLAARHQMIKETVEAFRGEFGVGREFNKEVGKRFRSDHKAIDELIHEGTCPTPEMGRGLGCLFERRQRWAGACAELKRLEAAGDLETPLAQIARSLLHMHANRMLRSAARAQELVLYDLLYRIYDSRLARLRQRNAGGHA